MNLKTCYWRQGELERIIPGPHHKDNAYKALWLIKIFYFHMDPEPIFHFNKGLSSRFFKLILSGSDFHSDADSDSTFYSLDPGSNPEVKLIKL
jgi:hypothetical protein